MDRRNPLLWAVLASLVVVGTAVSDKPGLLGVVAFGAAWLITRLAR